ncbi:two component transcriptional regulator, winged helix family [Ruminiclostridium papyrosolvens DSM 2782]|uniref:Stage 0 sporulation protein A homolog n=1 Tax=Ruminiclostridium papyrosolvens DSM 2782 TaxID=588581 RepID=F1T7Q3_9FIRM|nr:response regulator transcription factor [Ruminiclostridium papyrosolvens]EGD49501.1 two component transcriptional regulator, winged helix family [Ruminiclostridium papyrosolvens DSM 2782]WES33374.1 response regulator transcription factor [Ruminiclostridium papyrosolvens DSM 2782]
MGLIKILIADDEERMRRLVADFLKKQGYAVIEADNGMKALQIIIEQKETISLVILDVMMPIMDGWEALRSIRQYSKVPVIMLTAKCTEADELLSFGIGADEYITKPFSLMILLARVQALLKRLNININGKKSFDGLEIDLPAHTVHVSGQEIELTPKEFELLLYLCDNDGIALSREKILNSVWDYGYFGDVRTVDTHIKKLRLKLGEKGDFIQTIRGLGYKFEVTK